MTDHRDYQPTIIENYREEQEYFDACERLIKGKYCEAIVDLMDIPEGIGSENFKTKISQIFLDIGDEAEEITREYFND